MNIYESTNIRPYHIILLGFLGLGFLLIFSLAPNAFTNLASFFYPAYQTLYILRSGSTTQNPQYKQWLMYWVVVSLLNVSESITNTLVLWVPLYYSLKLCFIIWMAHPAIHGAEQIYNYLSPVFFAIIDNMESYIRSYSGHGETSDGTYVKKKSHDM